MSLLNRARGTIWHSIESHRLLAVILAAFVALATLYSIVTPIFEAGDELWHYPFVQFLATGHSLPIQDPNVRTRWEQEGGQPPLYYAVSALATFWIDTRDLPDRLWRNPEAKIGIPLDYGNKNMVVHTSAEDFPWHNTALAVHLIRFLSILFAAFTVLFTYLLALEIGANITLAAVAAALVAFNPMFIFISASVNNDNLAVMLATLALLLLTRLVTRGANLRQFVVLGVVLGLGALSKESDLGLVVIAAGVFLYLLWKAWDADRRRQTRIDLSSPRSSAPEGVRVLLEALLCAVIVVAIAGWWYARNWLLYHDPLAFNVWVAIAGGRPTPATLVTLLGEFQGFRISYWGNFGGVNIIAPDWVYVILDLFTGLAVIGLLIGIARRALPRLLALPALWLALIVVLLIRWTLLTFASQGRLIFPAISAVAILMAYGLGQFRISDFGFQIAPVIARFTSHASRMTQFALPAFLFGFSALTPFALIAPAYALPARLSGDAAVPNPVHITFDNQAELVGYTLPQKSVAPGGELPLTIYWRAVTRMTEDYSVYIRLYDSTGAVVGRWDAFPGGGLYPTRLWQPGEIIVDQYRVPVTFDAPGPGVGRIEVGLFRRLPLQDLTARDPAGRTITPTVARFKIAGVSNVKIENPVTYNFGDKMALVGYSAPGTAALGSEISVKLFWRSLVVMNEDYTVFVHLVDADGKTVAQKDAPPQSGAYPTSFWDVGEVIEDEHVLAIPRDLPPGNYTIDVGIYRASDDTRLPVQGGSTHVVVATVRVIQ